MLAIGMVGQAAGTVVVSCPPLLIPYLFLERGTSLVQAGWIATAPTLGLLVSLVAWGALIDRRGERLAMSAGLFIVTTAAVAAALSVQSLTALALCFFVVGIGAGSTNAASGRLVVGWFGATERGLAMGIRQTALPLGLGIAALIVPTVTNRWSLSAAITVVALISAAATVVCALGIRNPPRPKPDPSAESAGHTSPYRQSSVLLRIHLASALLVIPQIAIWTYLLLWLVDSRGWSTGGAAIIVAATHVLSSAGRIGAGWWSDRVGSRLGPVRAIAIGTSVAFVCLGIAEGSPIAVGLAILATVLSVSDNGLSFTAVAETAGPNWSGRAFGWQNTGQYATSALVPPAMASFLTMSSYSVTFIALAAFPLLALIALGRVSVDTENSGG